MPRHGAAVLRPAVGALVTSLSTALVAWSLAACADGAGAPTSPAARADAGSVGAPVAATAHDIGADPIHALLLDTFFVRESQKIRDNVEAAWSSLYYGKGTDCADALFLSNLTLDRLAAGALGPSYGAADPATAKRVNTLLAWLAPACPDVPPSLPAEALSPNGLAVPVDPASAYSLTTRDGVLHLELPAGTFTRGAVLVATRLPAAAGPGGGPFATTLPIYGPLYRLTTYPAAQRTGGGAIDLALALVGGSRPPKSAIGQLLPIFTQTEPPTPGAGTRAVIGYGSRLLVGSPGYVTPPSVSITPKPFISDSSTQSGSTSGTIPTLDSACDNADDCSFYRYAGLRGAADVGTASLRGPSAGAASLSLPFDLTVAATRIYDPAVNGRAALSASHVCGLRYTITNSGGVDLVAIFQPVDRNGAAAGGMWRTPILVPAHGSRAVKITLPAGVSPSTVSAFHLMYGPTLAQVVRPGTTACP